MFGNRGHRIWLAPTLAAVAVLVVLVGQSAAASADQPLVLGIRATPNSGGGMLVNEVFYGYPAADMQLTAGDVILTVNGQFVNSHDDMRVAVDNIGDHATLVVAKQDGTFVQVDADVSRPYGNGKPVIKHVHRKVVRRPH